MELIEFPHKRKNHHCDLQTLSEALAIFREEIIEKPELISILKTYPLLLAWFVHLLPNDRISLEQFRKINPKYLIGKGTGYAIKFFTGHQADFGGYLETKAPANLARKTRYSFQLSDCFDIFLDDPSTRVFNNNYLRTNPLLRERQGNLGLNLVQNIQICGWDLSDIVCIVASSRPEIYEHYQPPELKSLKNVVRLSTMQTSPKPL